MTATQPKRAETGFTILELLVIIMMFGLMASTTLTAYLSSTHSAARSVANDGARILASTIEAKGLVEHNAADYAKELGGALPKNPCVANGVGYDIKESSCAVVVTAQVGSGCGDWIPDGFRIAKRSQELAQGRGLR